VTPELVDAGPGHVPRTRWQEPFEGSLTDVFQVQADIATKVAAALGVALGDSAQRELAAKPTTNLAAYDAFLKGETASQDLAAVDPPSLRSAIVFYLQAVALDSTFVPAWAQLARAQAILYGNSAPTPELAAQAHHATERAQLLGPGRPEGQLALCVYDRQVQIDNRQALAACESGLKLAPNNIDLLSNAAAAQASLGDWEASLQPLTRAATLDPRSPSVARRLAGTFLYLRRYPDAQTAIDRALALAPTNLYSIELKAMVALAQGDLAGARAVLRAGLAATDAGSLLAFFGAYDDLYWVLDDAQQQQLLTLPVSAFDNDLGNWALVRAETHALRGDQAAARVYADSAQRAYETQLRATPDDGQRHALRGLMLAYLGRKGEAVQEGERAVMLWPISRDAFQGAYIQHQLARIYLVVGEREKALDQLEPLLKIPYLLSPAWLRIDPNFAPLKGNARFERLAAGK
jgi:tetratricopeptide (TPR) repeat protein